MPKSQIGLQRFQTAAIWNHRAPAISQSASEIATKIGSKVEIATQPPKPKPIPYLACSPANFCETYLLICLRILRWKTLGISNDFFSGSDSHGTKHQVFSKIRGNFRAMFGAMFGLERKVSGIFRSAPFLTLREFPQERHLVLWGGRPPRSPKTPKKSK